MKDIFNSINKKDATLILQAIEKAYRRGWQQGYIACLINPEVNEDEIYKWRYKKDINKQIPAPENKSFYKASRSYFSLLERFKMEVQTEGEHQLYCKIEKSTTKGEKK